MLLLFTLVWMSFASEKLERWCGRRLKTNQCRSNGRAGWGTGCCTATGNSVVRIEKYNQLAVKLASSEVISASGLVKVIQVGAGVAIFRVSMTSKRYRYRFAANGCARTVLEAAAANRYSGTAARRPARWSDCADASSTQASWMTVKPDAVSAKILWQFSSMARNHPCRPSTCALNMARGFRCSSCEVLRPIQAALPSLRCPWSEALDA